MTHTDAGTAWLWMYEPVPPADGGSGVGALVSYHNSKLGSAGSSGPTHTSSIPPPVLGGDGASVSYHSSKLGSVGRSGPIHTSSTPPPPVPGTAMASVSYHSSRFGSAGSSGP